MEYYHVSRKQGILKVIITIEMLGVGFGTMIVSYLKLGGQEEKPNNTIQEMRSNYQLTN